MEDYKKIGQGLFSKPDGTELRICTEAGEITVTNDVTECSHDDSFLMRQKDCNGKFGDIGIALYSVIDRDDAYRLAGLLIAWAEAEHNNIHEVA